MERMTGPDALMLHMERRDTPMHTLKIMVLDPSRRGRAITLADLHAAITPYLGVVPRATQKVYAAPGFGGRPFWVDDPDFELQAHLEEQHLAAPGSRAQLDEVCARLAERHLDRERPLWSLTLVHGLEGGRQAVVVRLHHAVSDGIAALNTFLAVTTETPGELPPACHRESSAIPDVDVLRQVAFRELAQLVTGVGRLVRTGLDSRRVTVGFGDRSGVPALLSGPRTSFNTVSGGSRVCASAELDLAALKRVGRATGATINGVLHAVIAGAMREEYVARGDTLDQPAVATFGVAADTASQRRWGNGIAPASVYLHVDLADAADRLRATARSCLLGVDLRRRRGFDLTNQLSTYLPRAAPMLRAGFAPYAPRVVNNITTANVVGPKVRRWFGDVEVVDWISFAVAVAPADVNLTAYSYDGRLAIGLVATPESMPDPAAFLARLQPALDELLALPHVDRESADV